MAKEKKTAPTPLKTPTNSFEKLENWTIKNDHKIFRVLLFFCVFLSCISFNARISEAHDDALYLEGGWRFVNEFPTYFYTQNAPLYPMFLAVLVKIMGLRLIIFKVFSLLFNIGGFVLLYKALKGRLPAVVFLPIVIFQATNYLIVYYASMTFTEAFYFFLQGLFFFYGTKIIDAVAAEGVDIKRQIKLWLVLGLSMFLISTAKSSAVVVIPAILLFFVLQKNWKAAGFSLAAYLIYKVPYEILVRLTWKAQNQFKGQSKILMQKDPYDASAGEEDVSGFISRLFDNTDLSLSKRFYQLIGWRDELATETYTLITLITLGLAIFGFVKLIRHKNQTMLLLSLFTGGQLLLSYLILQIRWDQPRITLVCMPVLLTLIFYGIYSLTKQKQWFAIYFTIVILVTGSVVISSFKRGFKNVPIIQKNLKGDKYFGYTPDWQNFLKCSEWAADSLPQSALVASRKAPMSFVYGKGKKFFPVYSVVHRDSITRMSNPDSALAYFKKNNVTHVMLASLRANPYDPSVGIINTVHHIFYPVLEKYPDKLRLVHTEGQFEQTELFEIVY